MAYLGEHWAAHGYVAVHIQHPGSDEAVWRGQARPMEAMRRAANAANAVARPRDLSFAIDQVEAANDAAGLLRGRLDLARIGVAGHSFGAQTALLAAGQALIGRRGFSMRFTDPRVKAALPMSAPPATYPSRAYADVAIPCFHMTGTLDRSPISDTRPEERRIPFDSIQGPDQYLIIFRGGDHMIFSGRRRMGDGSKDARFQELIRIGSTAFWDAHLRGDSAALAWLSEGGFDRVLGDAGVFERKSGGAGE